MAENTKGIVAKAVADFLRHLGSATRLLTRQGLQQDLTLVAAYAWFAGVETD